MKLGKKVTFITNESYLDSFLERVTQWIKVLHWNRKVANWNYTAAQLGLVTQPHYDASGELPAKHRVKNAVVNITIVRMSPLQWPEGAQKIAKQQVKKVPYHKLTQ